MKDLNSVFSQIQKLKKEQREIRAAYKDSLKSSDVYQKILDELTELKNRKKEIEDGIKLEMKSSFEKLENLKYDIETSNEMMSDIALTHFAKGEPIQIKDEYENEYEPIFSVKFRKIS